MRASFQLMPSKTFTPKNSKIFIETSVLLAGSIRVSFPDLGELRDEFYHPAIQLFSLLKKNIANGLGITTQTVEAEANRTLGTAVMNTLDRRIRDKKKVFEIKSVAWNICEENMRKLVNNLLREPIDESELPPYSNDVHIMYRELEYRAQTDEEIIDAAHKKAEGASGAAMRTVTFSAEIENGKRENASLARLARTHASPSDIKILAEAIYIARRYERRYGVNPFTLLFASTDSNNFVPCRTQFGPSTTLRDDIKSRFKINCDCPQEIFDLY